MPGECQSTLPVESTVQFENTFLSKASIESLSHNPSPEDNAAHAKNLLATGRQYWKTRGSQGEAIWPPHVEIALLEGLALYQKNTWKPIRDHRCPMRNKFISIHIEKTTGVYRTPRQISSRIQHLRDTCQAQSILNLITPSKPAASSSSPSQTPRPPSRPGNPYPRLPESPRLMSPYSLSHRDDSPLENDQLEDLPLQGPDNFQIAEPVPLRPSAPPPILTASLSRFLSEANSSEFSDLETPQSPTRDSDSMSLQDATEPCSAILQRNSPTRRTLASFYNVDVLLDNTTSSVPLIPLAALDDLEPLQISLGPYETSLPDGSFILDTVVQLVSPCPLLTQTVLSVFVRGCQTSIYTEATTLLCNSVPICGTDWFYMVSLPSFWDTLSDAADPGDYFIKQTIMPLRPEALANGLDYAGAQDEPSKITICYRFCSTKPSSTSLDFDARAYPLLQNPSVWHGTPSPHSNLMSSPDPFPMHYQYSVFHQNNFHSVEPYDRITPNLHFSSAFGSVLIE